MKLKKSMIIFIVLFSVIVVSVSLFKIHTHTFSNFVSDKCNIGVFYPKGIANKYKNIFAGINEEHKLWKYNLNSKETNYDLLNGAWQPLCCEELEYIYEVYFDETFIDFNETDQLYYCLFDLEKEKHTNIDINDILLYNQENLLFVYNKTTAEYYCVSKMS